MRLTGRIIATIAALTAFAIAPAAAQGGTVSVEEVPGETNRSVLHFVAGPGEQNELRVAVPTFATWEGHSLVEVADLGAGLAVGPGCAGGGAGSLAVCRLHLPHDEDYEPCGKMCVKRLPGTAWQDAMKIELGDGSDTFKAVGFDGSYIKSWPMEVDGGSGNDLIATGSGNDRIVPGPGNDTVSPGKGMDTVVADAQADGNDTFDFGTGTLNAIDDSARSEPLHLEDHVLGAAGEEDKISGFVEVIGGSGNDYFHSSGEWLNGGPGNDTLIGSPGKDYIFGGPGNDTIRGEAGDDWLYGGEGDDTVEGSPGNDFLVEGLEEKPAPAELLVTKNAPNSGNDRLYGGEGNDFVRAGSGNDLVDGGPGNDRLYGEAGNDTIEGGPGDDEVAGEEGDDELRGGEGNDKLLAGYNYEYLGGGDSGHGVDAGVDWLDCGPGEGFASANIWDHVENCETVHRVRAVMVEKVRHDLAAGTAKVSFRAYEMKGVTLRVGGRGVRELAYTSPTPGYAETKDSFVVRARGAALAKLRRHGRVRLALQLTWEPTDGTATTETRRVTLVLRKRHRKVHRHHRRHAAHHHRGTAGRTR